MCQQREREATEAAAAAVAAAWLLRGCSRRLYLRVEILGKGADDRDLHAVAAAVLGELGRHLRAREKREGCGGWVLGNRQHSSAAEAGEVLRFCARGAARTVIFMWPSVVFQPRTAYADVMS